MGEQKNRKRNRLTGHDYNKPGVYFLTVCTENRRCLLSRIVGTGVLDGPSIELLPYGEIAEKYVHQISGFYDGLSVEGYVIMPNHIHLLLAVKEKGPSGTPVPTKPGSAEGGPSGTPVPTKPGSAEDGPSGTPVPTVQNSVVSRFVSTFKRFCNREYGKNIWQGRFYDHIIRDQADYDVHLKYIHDNPFAWQKDELYASE